MKIRLVVATCTPDQREVKVCVLYFYTHLYLYYQCTFELDALLETSNFDLDSFLLNSQYYAWQRLLLSLLGADSMAKDEQKEKVVLL